MAVEDPALRAAVVTRTPLYYTEGADASLDRPAHVRAGSSLAHVPGGLAVVQDDANFIALIRDQAHVRAIPLPPGPGGLRQFDDGRGNKAHKLDLEACVSVGTIDQGVLLLAFGSGSTPARENVAVIRGWLDPEPHVSVVHVPWLYEGIRRNREFAGSELNLEGAIYLRGGLRLFGRGNGAPRDGLQPVNATCDLDLATLLEHLRAPQRYAPPAPRKVVRYDLGTFDGLPLGFTDAASWGRAVLYTATAEDSPDATRDGRVSGSALGVIDGAGRARWTLLVDGVGAPFTGKVEGIVTDRRRNRVLVVVDADDPAAPSELCEVHLTGEWLSP